MYILNRKNKKYSEDQIAKLCKDLWRLINKNWDGTSVFRLTRKGKNPDPILSLACSRSDIWYDDLPKEFSVFRPKSHAIEWRKQLHPCKFHKNNKDEINRFKDIGES